VEVFAYVVSPRTIEQLKSLWPAVKIVPNFILKPYLKNTPCFKLAHIPKARSNHGKDIEGYIIACPFFAPQTKELDEGFIRAKIMASSQVASQLQAGILGLDGYTARLVEKNINLLRHLKISVTTGSTLTAWSVIEAIYRTCKSKNISLLESTLAVIGATGSVGSLCARKLAEYVPKIILNGEYSDKLTRLKESIQHLNPIEVLIEEDVHKMLKDADIVVNANDLPGTALNPEEFKPKAIVCDVSLSRNIISKAHQRQDITVIEAGLIKFPYPMALRINWGLPKDIIPASLAETMLLAFEERLVSYSLGDNINLDKLEEIANIAVRHGLEVWVPGAPVL
jgi:predicted amino acid dehydrogenase